jgi:hypothetical protein
MAMECRQVSRGEHEGEQSNNFKRKKLQKKRNQIKSRK